MKGTSKAQKPEESDEGEGPETSPSTPKKQRGIRNSIVGMTKSTKDGLGQATNLTTTRLSQASASAIRQSERVYKESQWCFFARFVGKFPKYFPRTFYFIFFVIVPLWLLIFIALGFGNILARYEAIGELESNGDILESRARYNRTERLLEKVSEDCYNRSIHESNVSLFQQRIDRYLLASTINVGDEVDGSWNTINGTDVNSTAFNVANATITVEETGMNELNLTFGDDDNDTVHDNNHYTIEDLLMDSQREVLRHVAQCQVEENVRIAARSIENSTILPQHTTSLSFNWNRCLSNVIRDEYASANGGVTFNPDEILIRASHPTQQEYTYETEFVRMQNEAEQNCVLEGGLADSCFEKGLSVATGESGGLSAGDVVCQINVEGTSWFFFTIMTTVGYGNQAPVTESGRILIIVAGMICLVLFAGVLALAGYTIMAIFDDFVSRNFISKFLQCSLAGVILWLSIWFAWALLIAHRVDVWYQDRLPDFDANLKNTFWFAFISTSTIGLGDFFLQPEVMFGSDALSFSVLFLIGFVFLSTFLNKLAECISSVLPKRENSLETRLKGTNIFLWKHWPCTAYLPTSFIASNAHNDDDGSIRESDTQLGNSEQRRQQAEWVEALKSRLPSQSLPPTLDTTNAVDEKNMNKLLDEEETMLRALLELVETRQRNEIQNQESSEPTVVVTKSLMMGTGPSSEPNSQEFAMADSEDCLLSA